ncbi:Piso0_004753 [Millerozyma farinosa CBS 7064]|uniref:Piso0_004753 protein n=1 Tax=Pichia sorbitophila (strain ATCC MYA-4447 / BCRC 22081 / CBS 7064 / NBRC 10061 / NRRL Y-12695) TaxID=559304 RepID=G8Y0B7_PICSO|nr:Piso0_004753 [Millerozyma farinosa CBS 7064]
MNDLKDMDKKTAIVQVDTVSEAGSVKENLENESKLRRRLERRHVEMLALVGIFGTGLFLSSGQSLALTGNAGMFVAYLFVGLIVCANQAANAEVSSFMPITGFYIKHAEHLIDESFGFALGWVMIYGALIPSELAAGAVVISYWSDLNPAVWITILGISVVLSTAFGVRFYGELEYVMGVLKVILIMGLFIVCLVIDLGGSKGQERIGFRYWKETPWNEYYTTGSLGKFLAFWKCVSGVVYSYGGVQYISLFGGETKHPRRSIFLAAKRIAIRVLTLYLSIVLVLTMVLSSKEPEITTSSGTASHSPFVIAIKKAKIKVLPHIINAVVLSSAISAANLSQMQVSRILYAMASNGRAPGIFLKTTKAGVPYVGIIFVSSFIPLAYMSCSRNASTVFSWFQSITSSNLLVGWCTISLNHIFLHRALKAQGYGRDVLPYRSRFGPYAAWISLFFSLLILLTAGFSNFLKGKFDISSFFSCYFVIPLLIVLTLFWKIFKKSKLHRPEDVDLKTFFDDIEQNPEPPIKGTGGKERFLILWA